MKFHWLISKTDGFRTIIQKRILAQRLDFPLLVSLELTNACNAQCIMCPRERMTRAVKIMDMKLVEKIAGNLREHSVHKVNLFWFGESLLHPQSLEILRLLRKTVPGTKLNLSTNGQVLDGTLAMGVLTSGIDTLNVDIDGSEKETFEGIRRKLSFEKVTRNLVEFMELRKEMRLKRPRVSVTMIEMKDTENEVASFTKMWKRVVDDIHVTKYNTWCRQVEDRNTFRTAESINGRGFTFPCENPWKELVISAEGKAVLCCLDFNASMPVGDVTTQSLEEIWKGNALSKVRALLISGRQSEIPLCRGCNAHIFQEESFWANLWRWDGSPPNGHGNTR